MAPRYTPAVFRRRLHQLVLAIYVALIVGSVGLVVGPFLNDRAISAQPNRALATVKDVGVLRTTEAPGSNSGLWWLFGVTFLVYAAMTVGAYVVLRSMARRWRSGELDLPSPYGPQARLSDTQRTDR